MNSLCNICSRFNKQYLKYLFLFKSSKELTLVVRSCKDLNSGYPKFKNNVWVNADHGRDLHPLADHLTKLRNFTMDENRDFSAFTISLQLMVEQALTNLIFCLMISQKLHTNVVQTN